MENQVPEDEVKENFDKVLLKTVQDTARSRVGNLLGQTVTVLVEEKNEQDDSSGNRTYVQQYDRSFPGRRGSDRNACRSTSG